jgi:hypothetical protein
MKLHSDARLIISGCFVALLLVLMPISFAAENKPSAEKLELIYEMKQGDTLLALVAKYFSTDAALAEIIRVNQIKNPSRIPVGQKIIFPRDLLLFSSSYARLTTLDCDGSVVMPNENKSLHLGDVIAQGALVKTPKGCEVGMTLDDGSVVSLLPGTLVRVKTLRKTSLEKSPEVELELLGGRVDVDVPKRQAGDAPYQVRTPSSLAGVRGTKFRVAFDEEQHNSQVEVNHGNVAARGSADMTIKSVLDNMGVAISASGVAGDVESLPVAPLYSGFEYNKSSSVTKLKFSPSSQDLKYLLSKSTNANSIGRNADYVLTKAEFEASNLVAKATFYRIAALSKTGLMGEAKSYGFCASSDSQKNNCNVNFNMHGIQSVEMHLARQRQEENIFEDVINTTVDVSKNDQLLFKNLPAGHYQWSQSYVIDGGLLVHKSGDFELVAISDK